MFSRHINSLNSAVKNEEPFNASRDFESTEGHVWLNCAHQGPLPRVAAEEAREAILFKTELHRLKDEFFSEVPARLKRVLGSLIEAPADEIILGNSASYSLHLLANGILMAQVSAGCVPN